jgi:viroplasmin and RNaseH domain-containing protein
MKKKNTVYVIFIGRETGVFNEPWDIVRKHVDGYPGAICKGYRTLVEAQNAWDNRQDKGDLSWYCNSEEANHSTTVL